jgi:NADH dehydrogenase (ubiquinone) 1 alpha subcomplex subunit 9
VFGPSHLLGRSLVNRLGKIGSQIIVAYRGEPYKLREMKVAADLGQVLFFPTNVLDETSVKRALEYSNVCINLVGSRLMRATMNFSNTDVHVNAARLIARCARQVGVQRLVHVSALNASHNPPQFVKKGGSDFYRMKAAGEEAVRSEFPNAIVFRPSDMFGFDDSFLHYYAARKRRSAGGALCLWELGRETIKAPVFYSDVAQGIVNALLYQGTDGQTYECVGPYRYILADLVDYMYQCMQWFDPHIKLTNFTLPFLYSLPSE